MNVKSLIIVGLSIATLGLSLPAHANDTATVVDNNQDAFITGDWNTTNQSNRTDVSNRQHGRQIPGNTGAVVNNRQVLDVAGSDNLVNQDNQANVENVRTRVRR